MTPVLQIHEFELFCQDGYPSYPSSLLEFLFNLQEMRVRGPDQGWRASCQRRDREKTLLEDLSESPQKEAGPAGARSRVSRDAPPRNQTQWRPKKERPPCSKNGGQPKSANFRPLPLPFIRVKRRLDPFSLDPF